MLELVIPDTGPLITFGSIGRFDLIDRFNCAIVLTDYVFHEVARGPDDALDKERFLKWTESRGNRIQTVETLYGILWRNVDEATRKSLRDRDKGERSVQEFADKIRGRLAGDGQCLVLFEDERVKDMYFGDHVHLIHTWAFLVSLERLGVIPSAQAIFNEVNATGVRNLKKDPFERRAKTNREATEWVSGYNSQTDDLYQPGGDGNLQNRGDK